MFMRTKPIYDDYVGHPFEKKTIMFTNVIDCGLCLLSLGLNSGAYNNLKCPMH